MFAFDHIMRACSETMGGGQWRFVTKCDRSPMDQGDVEESVAGIRI